VQSILQLCGAVEADTGQYSCFTNNTLGNDIGFFDLTVGKQLYNLNRNMVLLTLNAKYLERLILPQS